MRKFNISKKAVALSMAMVLAFGCGVGGTLAWLTAETDDVKNTFTTSDIGVELEETTTDYQIIPGFDIEKDPKAWVTTGSEDAYLFVKIVESTDAKFSDFMTYTIADGWTALTGVDGVYYREVTEANMGETNAFSILKDDKVTVLETVTKEDMYPFDGEVDGTGLTEEQITAAQNAELAKRPTLTFTAYAHQLYQDVGTKFDVADAWSNLTSGTN